MRSASQRVLLLVGCCAVWLATLAPAAFAQQATPVAGGDWPPPPSSCSGGQLLDPNDLRVEAPKGGALVRPASAPNQDLYLLEVTLKSGDCVGYDAHLRHDGAIVWFVQSGQIALSIMPIQGRPAPDIAAGRRDGSALRVTSRMVLEAGDWVSIDRMADYQYRNTGTGQAVVMMTVLEERQPWQGDLGATAMAAGGCKGICKNPRR
ncbi:MAG: hypothetical protein QM692_00745 [Thermomicrobiales bacterium]